MLWSVLAVVALSVRAIESKNLKIADTFVIGVSKCGTSSMFQTLVKSPEICAAKDESGRNMKTLNHFTLPWYWTRKKVDDMEEKFSNCSWDQRRLDSSESYSARAIVPQNIRTLYEQYGLDKNRIKFIMVIRDPLERAYAWYNFGVGINLPGFNVTFEEKIEEEVGRISECQNYAKSHGITDETNVWAHCSKIFLNYDGSTVFPGMMASALKYWFRFFDPAQFLILPLNEYRDNFSDVKKRIAQHLNLKDDSVFEQEHSDHGRKPYVLPKMPQKLIDHFYNEREQMAELVQKTPHSFFRVLEQPSFLALQNVNISRSGRHPKQLSHQQGILDMYTNS